VDGGGDCAHNGVLGTRQNHLKLSLVTLHHSHRIPTIGTNYVCGYRDGVVCGGGDVGSDESGESDVVLLNLADRERRSNRYRLEKSLSLASSGMRKPWWRLDLLPQVHQLHLELPSGQK